ncbi:CbtA family protein [Profundibacter sp.]|uniref:CbtA family protein n=1 Tax=Profundibacter sp. TaxID=3101071 RepID=UPI003D0E8CB8
MTARLFTSALFAGLVAGLIAVLLQWALMEKLILEGEEYETGNKSHFGGVLVINEAQETANPDAAPTEDAAPAEDDEESLFTRYSLAFFADFTTFVGWSLMMVAGFALAERFGQRITIKDALIWGGAGFAAIQIMPGIGLAPELPGTPAAELEARQLWWVATAISAALAFALFGYGRTLLYVVIGIALLIAPQLIGAPRLDGYAGVAPPELAGEYVARSYAVAFIDWIVLGLAAGYFWNRGADTQNA